MTEKTILLVSIIFIASLVVLSIVKNFPEAATNFDRIIGGTFGGYRESTTTTTLPYVIFIGYNSKPPNPEVGYDHEVKFAKSTDGGDTWTIKLIDTDDVDRYVSVYAPDANTIFMVYKVVNGNKLKFAKSTDGGDTWTINVIDTGCNCWTNSIQAVDSKTIFVIYNDDINDAPDECGSSFHNYDGMKFAKSTDGGNTWSVRYMCNNDLGNNGKFGHCLPESLAAVDKNTIYISYQQHGLDNVLITKSTDGGNTWTPKVVVPSYDAHHCSSIHALDKENVFISYQGTPSATIWDVRFAKSTDGGNTWTTNIVDPDNFVNYLETDIHAVDTDNIFISYYSESPSKMKFAKSIDGGNTWSTQTVDDGSVTFNHALDANTIFLSYYYDGNMKFAKSTDGGNTWSIKTIDKGYLSSVYAVNLQPPTTTTSTTETTSSSTTTTSTTTTQPTTTTTTIPSECASKSCEYKNPSACKCGALTCYQDTYCCSSKNICYSDQSSCQANCGGTTTTISSTTTTQPSSTTTSSSSTTTTKSTTTTSTTIKKSTSTTQTKRQCPFQCCVNEPNYYDKSCDEGYNCVQNACIKAEEKINYSYILYMTGFILALLAVVGAVYFYQKRIRNKWKKLYRKWSPH
jgi:photosystem II stability/assembly factor-like uncharacterized protein